jgi:hypothetical protein
MISWSAKRFGTTAFFITAQGQQGQQQQQGVDVMVVRVVRSGQLVHVHSIGCEAVISGLAEPRLSLASVLPELSRICCC